MSHDLINEARQSETNQRSIRDFCERSDLDHVNEADECECLNLNALINDKRVQNGRSAEFRLLATPFGGYLSQNKSGASLKSPPIINEAEGNLFLSKSILVDNP